MMQTDPYDIIEKRVAPEVLKRFISKGADYGDAWKLLGARGQFSDINRKFWKLYKSIWLGEELRGEQPDECAEDIIGHCLLLLYIIRYEGTPERPDFSSPTGLVPPTLPTSEPARVGEDPDRCPATVETGRGTVLRCELYRGHGGHNHLAEIGTVNQYQWGDE